MDKTISKATATNWDVAVLSQIITNGSQLVAVVYNRYGVVIDGILATNTSQTLRGRKLDLPKCRVVHVTQPEIDSFIGELQALPRRRTR